MPFLPRTHEIPPGVRHPRFHIRPITVHDAVRDFDAVMSSAARLRERFPLGGGWPPDTMTLEENLIDLAWHQKEALLRRSFNYAVTSPDGSRLLGCVYVEPPEKRGADADVSFWVRDEEEGTGLEEELEAAVRAWLATSWPYASVRWPGRDISWEEWDLLPDAE
ncbi:GNAT family N-acetyltransferase [Streptosporangium sp. NPDC023615]|uniref:GNAT family N-acetyltransferase n=1 Tax=Streptosporangium sp. NPDC023615 TaxID=3154794 RepID=UPI003445947E